MKMFGTNFLEQWLTDNKLTTVCRAHQVTLNKCPVYYELYSTTTPSYPICTTIFSQENYDSNTGGYLTILTNEDNSQFTYEPYVNESPPKNCPQKCTEDKCVRIQFNAKKHSPPIIIVRPL